MGLDEYFMSRLLDAMLREDLFGLASRGQIQTPGPLPDHAGAWLRFDWDETTRWWLPVLGEARLQEWRPALPWLYEERAQGGRRLDRPEQLGERLAQRVDEGPALLEELGCSLQHRNWAVAEQKRWFEADAERPERWSDWLLYYDRLASFQDHPYYPTARAKIGFSEEDLRRYAPESGARFRLRWLAVPAPLLDPLQGQLPDWWPAAPEGHLLVPVHPHTLTRLDDFPPPGSQLQPEPALEAQATLSVRTVQLTEHPSCHLKLPLFMRSLSYKNIRKIKPDTIRDGHTVQTLLSGLLRRRPELAPYCLLSDESTGMSVGQRPDLGCILRRYPDRELGGCRVLPSAALLAPSPSGKTVLADLVASHFDGDARRFYRRYVQLTLRLHLTLWCLYGIALESNQQNTLLVLGENGELRLLLKDNDAARIYLDYARTQLPNGLAKLLDDLCDPCIAVDGWLPLAQMFITITLQLNLLPFLDHAPELGLDRREIYQLTLELLLEILARFPADKVERSQVRAWLLESPHHYVKYLFSAGTLYSKARTGAGDINKYYGLTAPNCFAALRAH